MRSFITTAMPLVFLFAFLCSIRSALASGQILERLASPDGKIQVIVTEGGASGALFYRVLLNGQVLIRDSRLGLDFLGAGPLQSLQILRQSHRSSNSTYEMPFGKARVIRDHYREAKLEFEEKLSPYRRIDVIFRAYDDGVAFRYVIPEQKALSDFVIREEQTQIAVAGEPTLFALPLAFGSSYEALYKTGPMTSFEPGATLGLPLVLGYPHGVYVGISEAALVDYAGLYVTPSKSLAGTLEARLAPSLADPEVKVTGRAPLKTPWRAFVVGSSPKVLVESNLIDNLNEPSVIQDTSWIHPGKVQFPWWNGYVVPNDPDHLAGLNTWTLKHYIDFCSENHIAYHSLDGYEMEQAWYGGNVVPYEGADITRARSEIDLPEVLRYAKQRGVGTRVWFDDDGLMNRDIDAVFTAYENMGVSGIMSDFLNRDDQLAVKFYNDVLKSAAQHHLTVAFHGVFKPTGRGRTYPNLLSQEAVYGLEYDKWAAEGSPADHEVMIAFVRMLAGPLDTHEGSFRPIAPADFQAQSIAPRAMGTLARMIAMYVVYENYQPMLADYPEAYLAHPEAFAFVQKVPVVWQETKFISGDIGHSIAIARRDRRDWYVGAINDLTPRHLNLPLNFLGAGRYLAEIYSDDVSTKPDRESVVVKRLKVTSNDTIGLDLIADGGNAIHFSRLGDGRDD